MHLLGRVGGLTKKALCPETGRFNQGNHVRSSFGGPREAKEWSGWEGDSPLNVCTWPSRGMGTCALRCSVVIFDAVSQIGNTQAHVYGRSRGSHFWCLELPQSACVHVLLPSPWLLCSAFFVSVVQAIA